jgi:hypothetical protein
MLWLYFVIDGVLNFALGHGPDHLKQAFDAKKLPTPRVVLGTHEPIGADAQAALEKRWGAKPGAPVEVQLPPYVFRRDKGADARYLNKLAEAKAKEAAATAPAK